MPHPVYEDHFTFSVQSKVCKRTNPYIAEITVGNENCSSFIPSFSVHTFLRSPIWQYGLWSFQIGGTKLERFLPKNQHTQRKLLNFENWVNPNRHYLRKKEKCAHLQHHLGAFFKRLNKLSKVSK